MSHDKLPYPISSIINEKYITWPEKENVIDILHTRISCLGKWVDNQWLDLCKQKKMKKQFRTCWDNSHQLGNESEMRRKRKFHKKKSSNKQRRKKYKRKYSNKPNSKRGRFFREAAYCSIIKNNYKWWTCIEIGHYANKCKNWKNNKLIETLGSLGYFEISEEKTLDLVLKNNNGTVGKMNMDQVIIKKLVI